MLVLLAVCLVVPVGGSRADDCKASVDSVLMKEEKEEKTVTYKFKVDVSSPDRCADVDYVLKVVEAVSGEEEPRTKEVSHRTRVRDGVQTSAKVDYKMPSNHQLGSWKFEVAGCQPCGAAKPD
jgi:hypothetical protein